MEIVDSRLRRILFGFFACVGAVIAWTALSLFLGSTHAQAAERSAGLLDDLTSNVTGTVTETVGTVTSLVDEIVAPVAQTASETVAHTVAQTVDPVLEVVASVPVVGPPAAELVEQTVSTATDTARDLVTPVVDVLGDQPIAHVVDPLLDSLERLPVVGSVLEQVRPVATPAVGGVDELLGSIGGTLDGTVDAVAPGGGSTQPAEPAQPGDDGSAGVAPGGDSEAVATSESPDSRASERSSNAIPAVSPAWAATSGNSPQGTSAPTLGAKGPPGSGGAPPGAPPGSSSTAPTSSANAGGGSAGSVASIADADPLPLRAWERAAGARDDAMPSSPVFDTDVSPD